MKKPLEQLVDLSNGFSFRGAVPAHNNGEIAVVQVGNISEDGLVNFHNVERVMLSSIAKNTLLVDGDILLVSRGVGKGSFRAATFFSDVPSIASHTLQVLRVKDYSVDPVYLCAYLNSQNGQSQLASIATGSSIKMLSLNELKRLKVPVPTNEQQKTIVCLTRNINQQSVMLARKKQLISKLHQAAVTAISET